MKEALAIKPAMRNVFLSSEESAVDKLNGKRGMLHGLAADCFSLLFFELRRRYGIVENCADRKN